MTPRYGIHEWYGESITGISSARRQQLAEIALGRDSVLPPCPFQQDHPPCRKAGGVCSMRRYESGTRGRIGNPTGQPVIMCPQRFEERQVLVRWLADIVGFTGTDTQMAREVPFMMGTGTGKPAGMIDLVVARTMDGRLDWYGLEVQAVYFSGRGMQSEFARLALDSYNSPPFPDAARRPDWRSSSAKRLMPQLQVKVPTLRRWAAKMAVAVDRPFFDAIGGPSPNPTRDLGDGDVIWLVPELDSGHRLVRGHWEVLTLEQSSEKLQAAETVRQADFEQMLLDKLESLN